jgi:hypothetical protein
LSELATAYDSGSPFGFRNRIINGDCRIDQRNAGAAVTISTGGSAIYSLDRWVGVNATDGTFTIQRSTVAPAGFTNSLLATVTSTDASIGSTQAINIRQNIEGFNVADLGWGTANAQPITIGFWVRSSVTGQYGVSVNNSAYNRSYPSSFTINSANTYEYKTVTIPGDTSGTWLTDNGIGLVLQISLSVGSSLIGTANTWSSSFFYGVSGQVNWIGNSGATFYITGVQLEAGSVATPFERRDYGRELMMCQRYYQVQASGSYVFAGRSSSTTAVLYSVPLQVAMRASPTLSSAAIIAYGPTSANLSSGGASTVITFGTNSLVIQRTGYTGITDDRCYNGYLSTDPLTLSSEL